MSIQQMLSVISITIIVISEGTENDWRSLEGFTAEMPLGLSSQIDIHKNGKREKGIPGRVAACAKRHMEVGN